MFRLTCYAGSEHFSLAMSRSECYKTRQHTRNDRHYEIIAKFVWNMRLVKAYDVSFSCLNRASDRQPVR